MFGQTEEMDGEENRGHAVQSTTDQTSLVDTPANTWKGLIENTFRNKLSTQSVLNIKVLQALQKSRRIVLSFAA